MNGNRSQSGSRLAIRRCYRIAAVPLVALWMPVVAAAQPSGTEQLREQVEARYEVTPIRGGIALLPQGEGLGDVTMIELRGEEVYFNGQPELRTPSDLAASLGSDAAVLLRLMYLDAPTQRAVLGLAPFTETELAELGLVDDARETAPADAAEPQRSRERRVVRRDIVRFGGRVHIDVDELVRGDVVVIGGILDVEGEVQGGITVVGGSARFGPEAVAGRGVTVVGGRLTRDPGAQFSGDVNEVTFDMFDFDFARFSGLPGFLGMRPVTMRGSMDFAGTLFRFAFFGLLGSVVFLVASGSAERVARRAAMEPLKSGFVGFLAQLLFVPLIVLGSLLLAVTIIGIPLLVLVPVVMVAALVVMVLGFAGVAQGVGQSVTRSAGMSRRSKVVVFWLGLAVLMTPTFFGEVLAGLAGPPFVMFAVILGFVGFVVEYAAWTAGVGAVILNRFDGPPAPAGGAPPLPSSAPLPQTPPPDNDPV